MNNDHSSSIHMDPDYDPSSQTSLYHNNNMNLSTTIIMPNNNPPHSTTATTSSSSHHTMIPSINSTSMYSPTNSSSVSVSFMNPSSSSFSNNVDPQDISSLPPSHRNSFSLASDAAFIMSPSMIMLPPDASMNQPPDNLPFPSSSSHSTMMMNISTTNGSSPQTNNNNNMHHHHTNSSNNNSNHHHHHHPILNYSQHPTNANYFTPPLHLSVLPDNNSLLNPPSHPSVDNLLFPQDYLPNNSNSNGSLQPNNNNVRRGSRSRKPTNYSRLEGGFIEDFEAFIPPVNTHPSSSSSMVISNDDQINGKNGNTTTITNRNSRNTSSTVNSNTSSSTTTNTTPGMVTNGTKPSTVSSSSNKSSHPSLANISLPFQLTTITGPTNKELLTSFNPTNIPVPTKEDIAISDDLDVPVAILPEVTILPQQELLLPPPLPPGALQHIPYSDTVKVSERLRTEGLPHDAFRRAKLMADVCRRGALLATEVSQAMQQLPPVMPSVSTVMDMNLRKHQLLEHRKRPRPTEPVVGGSSSSVGAPSSNSNDALSSSIPSNLLDTTTYDESNIPSSLSTEETMNNLTMIPNFANIWSMSNQNFSQSYLASPPYPNPSVATYAQQISSASENGTYEPDPGKDPNWLLKALHLRADVADAFLRAVLRDVAAEEEAEAERRRRAEERIRREKEKAEQRKKRAAGAREGRAKAKAKAKDAAAVTTTTTVGTTTTTDGTMFPSLVANTVIGSMDDNTETISTIVSNDPSKENVTVCTSVTTTTLTTGTRGDDDDAKKTTGLIMTEESQAQLPYTNANVSIPPIITTVIASLPNNDEEMNLFTTTSYASSSSTLSSVTKSVLVTVGQQPEEDTVSSSTSNFIQQSSSNKRSKLSTEIVSTPLLSSSSLVPTSPVVLTGAAAREAAALARKEGRLRDRAILNQLLMQNSSMSLSNPGPLLRSAMIYARCKATVMAAQKYTNTEETNIVVPIPSNNGGTLQTTTTIPLLPPPTVLPSSSSSSSTSTMAVASGTITTNSSATVSGSTGGSKHRWKGLVSPADGWIVTV